MLFTAYRRGLHYLLVATDARSTSRDRLRAMPCQKEENERSEVKSTKTIRMSLSRAGGCSRSAPSENAAVETRFQGRWQDSAYPIWLLRQLLAAFRRERFRPDAEPSNEVPAKSAGVRRLFYECSRSPLKPAF